MIEKSIHSIMIKKQPLSFEEEQFLFRYYLDNPSIELRNQIVEKNLGLVRKVVAYYKNSPYEYEEMIQEGCIGLITAVEKFNPDVGTKFSTYAFQWIKQAVNRYITNNRSAIRIPVHVRECHQKIQRISNEYENIHGCKPSISYLQSVLGLDNKKIEKVIAVCESADAVSLNTLNKSVENERSEIIDLIVDENMDPEKKITDFLYMSKVKESFEKHLTPREQKILVLRYGIEDGEEKTLKEIGQLIGMSLERVRQLEKISLNKLQHAKEIQVSVA